jgi:phosphate transport system substrate-binding protein
MEEYKVMSSFLKKASRLALVGLTAAALLVAGCAGGKTTEDGGLNGMLDVTGSNTVTPISTVWAEAFMADNPGVSISVSGPGSGAGIAALINKTTDICQSSRPIKASEITQAAGNGVIVVETKVAIDALSVVVNPANPVTTLTIKQLSDIYTGKITNWREVGGNDAPIVALSRDTNSGTYAYFLEEVVQLALVPELKDTKLQYAGGVQMLPSTEVGINQVAQNANAIFYPGLGYLTSAVKTLAIKKTESSAAVGPSVATALDGTYPISRFLYYYTNGQPTGVAEAFIAYGLSAEGQAEVEEMGFVPLKK